MILPVGVTFILNRKPPLTVLFIALCFAIQLYGASLDRKWPAQVARACEAQPEAVHVLHDYLMRPEQILFRKTFALDPIMENCAAVFTQTLQTNQISFHIARDRNLNAAGRTGLLLALDNFESVSGKYWRSRWGSDPTQWSIGRSVTSFFIHRGWIQLFFCLFFFWLFAGAVELLLGPLKFTAYVLLSGLIGDFLYSMFIYLSGSWSSPVVGSMGVVFGVMGIFIFLFPGEKIRFKRLPPLEEGVFDVPPAFMIPLFLIGNFISPLNPAGDALNLYSYFGSIAFSMVAGFMFFRREKAEFKILTIKAIG